MILLVGEKTMVNHGCHLLEIIGVKEVYHWHLKVTSHGTETTTMIKDGIDCKLSALVKTVMLNTTYK